MRHWLAFLLLSAYPGMAHAAWFQASSPHFVVYADASQANIRRYSQELELYHAAMALITTEEAPPPSPSNRVTVYVVSSVSEVRRLFGDKQGHVAAFYIPRAGGSLAITPRVTGGSGDLDFSMIALLHEYAHHFMISSTAFPMVRWYSEGAAEFFASARFESSGDVWLGRAANHRVAELFLAKDVTATNLIDPDTYHPPRGNGYDAYYGKSWLLFHYLTFDKDRAGQMQSYLRMLGEGKGSREAGQAAFGDLRKLESDLDSYFSRGRILAFKIPSARLSPGATVLRPLSPGEAAIMPVMIRSKRGVDAEQAAALISEARAVAVRFPADAAVQAALAEAEFDSGHDTEAIAAADAAMAIDRKQVNAYVQKGYALFRMAQNSGAPADYPRARVPFLALNRIENDHPIPLIYNYRTAMAETGRAASIAVQGLERAAQLAPFDLDLRMNVARREIYDGFRDAARSNLLPIAYNPHGGAMAKQAQAMIARLDSDPKWNGSDIGWQVPGESDDDSQ